MLACGLEDEVCLCAESVTCLLTWTGGEGEERETYEPERNRTIILHSN